LTQTIVPATIAIILANALKALDALFKVLL